jgi:hypothetical protein
MHKFVATSLAAGGASLSHIRRFLGHFSEKMAERYVHLAQSDLEDILQQVWGAGPGSATPGELLTGTGDPLTREQALALAVDLSRRSIPAEGGFCTFQPVVDGGACPWNLDCGTAISSCCPAPTFFTGGASADYFHRIWSTAFRATAAATLGEGPFLYLAEVGGCLLVVWQLGDGIHDGPGGDDVLHGGGGRQRGPPDIGAGTVDEAAGIAMRVPALVGVDPRDVPPGHGIMPRRRVSDAALIAQHLLERLVDHSLGVQMRLPQPLLGPALTDKSPQRT